MQRPELEACHAFLTAGDTLVVPSLDRYGRSLADLIAMVGELRRCEIGFASLHENLDTTTPGGRLVFHVFAVLAEFIRELIVAGTREGLAAARARGRERRTTVIDALFDLADTIITVRSLIRQVWTTHRWDERRTADRDRTPIRATSYSLAAHHAHVFGRCSAKTGIVPFTDLVEQVMSQGPYACRCQDRFTRGRETSVIRQ
ncbi:DNA invertase Pin-like site-specific DNA recombinase [Streptosporangium brasiliense]|uniref:DNA invertase Pin-like site-specific DNA recombinase n=1 Tax=Streptosporangium brasiliense TaxID=47480 RepID=A0ABT9RHA9_9ACTN|nr:DNA invertase Pin-like site-specific DNA recombinase [Streptosporangium brasiliense]